MLHITYGDLWWFMGDVCCFPMVLPWFHPHQRGISHGLPWPLPYPARTWRRSWHVWWRSSIRRWRRRTKSWRRRSAASGSWTWRRGQERRRNNILNWVYLYTHTYHTCMYYICHSLIVCTHAHMYIYIYMYIRWLFLEAMKPCFSIKSIT